MKQNAQNTDTTSFKADVQFTPSDASAAFCTVHSTGDDHLAQMALYKMQHPDHNILDGIVRGVGLLALFFAFVVPNLKKGK